MVNFRINAPGFSPPTGATPSLFQQEAMTTLSVLQDIGLPQPDAETLTAAGLVQGIAKPFIPEEMPPVNLIPNFSDANRTIFRDKLQPAIKDMLRRKDPRAIKLAHQTGRLLAAGVQSSSIGVKPPVQLEDDRLVTDGLSEQFSISKGLIIDHGMGIRGLYTHIDNLKRGKYALVASQPSSAEIGLIGGMIAFNNVDGRAVTVSAAGAARVSSQLLEMGYAEGADAIIASRVHSAGNQLRTALQLAPRLLRAGGLLVARGPRIYKSGMGYDAVRQQIANIPQIEISQETSYEQRTPIGRSESNRTIIAKKK